MKGMAEKLPTQIYCYACGRMEDIDKFYPNYSSFEKEYHYGRCLMCKPKAKEISQQIIKKYSNYQLGIIEMCSIFHLPYLPDVAKKLEEYDKNPINVVERDINRYFQYMKFANDSVDKGGCGYSFDNPVWSNFSYNSWIKLYLLKVAKGTKELDDDTFVELEQEWGKQEKLDDYLWLEERFHLYTDGEVLTPAMSNTVRYLCLAELDVNKLRNSKAEFKDKDLQDAITKAEKRVSDYYDKLKLSDFKFNKAKSDAEKLIENWAYIEENYSPIEWEDENNILKDRLGINEDYDDIMRSLGNKVLGMTQYPSLNAEDVKKKEKKYK
jgi:hypothetical protein